MSAIIAAFTEEQVERLTGISRRQLRYWDKTGFFEPSFGYDDRSVRFSRLYSFRDLACLRILYSLRSEANVSLQHLREVKEKLQHLGDDMWSKTTLHVLNRRVVFVNPETDAMEDVVSKQGILQIPLKVVSDGITDAIRQLNNRDSAEPRVVRRQSVAGNQYVIEGTRIPVENIKEFAEAGHSSSQIREQYPTLSEQEVMAALHFDPAA